MRRETQTLFGLMLSSFIVNLGFGAILPFMAIYANNFFHVWDWGFVKVNIVTQIGLLTSAMMISRAFLAPFYGKISDKAGRKPLMVVGMAMYVILTFGFGLAQAFWSLFLVRFFQGIASALVWPIAESAVVDISPNDKRGRNLGWFILSMSLGWSVGPFLGGGLFSLSELIVNTEVAAFRVAFFFMGAISSISFIVFNLMVIDPKTQKAKMSIKEIGIAIKEVIIVTVKIRPSIPEFLKPSFWKERTGSLRALFIMGFSNGFGFSMVFPILSLFLEERYLLSPNYIGYVFGIAGIAGVVFNPIGGYLADKTSKKVLVIITAMSSGILLFFLGFEMGLYALIGLFVGRQMVQQVNMPAFRALQADLIEAEKRGSEFGNVQMFFNLGAVIGPIIGGVIYDHFRYDSWNIAGLTTYGIEVILLITTIIAFFSALVTLLFVKKKDMVVFTKIPSQEEKEIVSVVIEGE
ncbi:MAG: MFS transporter [Asgard group archaeon]|nr:MFS transporter [Asgard group archaeon]